MSSVAKHIRNILKKCSNKCLQQSLNSLLETSRRNNNYCCLAFEASGIFTVSRIHHHQTEILILKKERAIGRGLNKIKFEDNNKSLA